MAEITRIPLPAGQVIGDRLRGQDRSQDDRFGEHARVLEMKQLAQLSGSVIRNACGALPRQADEAGVRFGIERPLRSGNAIGGRAEVGSTSGIVVHLSWKATPVRQQRAERAASAR